MTPTISSLFRRPFFHKKAGELSDEQHRAPETTRIQIVSTPDPKEAWYHDQHANHDVPFVCVPKRRLMIRVTTRDGVIERSIADAVLESFGLHRPEEALAVHVTGNSYDFRPIEGIRWMSEAEALQLELEHRQAQDRLLTGATNGGRRFTPQQVRAIRERREKGAKIGDMAAYFGASPSTIHRIVSRRHYADVE